MARAVLEKWRLAHSLGDFKAWLDRGAPSDDADAGSAAQPASNGSLLNSKSEFRNPETISKFEIEPKTQVRIDVVWNIESFCHLILFRASDFVLRIYPFIPLRLCAFARDNPTFGRGSAALGSFARAKKEAP